ncbi:hypothetical protein CHS0354_033098 [Potamilus streckersoni]|uniref:Uncharacterized protein n=1 Tax=Potamilus streckersoni TaxID=2493646 RepID=A0AAE0VMD8_9BIVA|nr:hypothetical protein CHS0354_033098 [Potamilus streckersoni]
MWKETGSQCMALRCVKGDWIMVYSPEICGRRLGYYMWKETGWQCKESGSWCMTLRYVEGDWMAVQGIWITVYGFEICGRRLDGSARNLDHGEWL